MILGATVEQALRALRHMATLPEDNIILGGDLAKAANVPANYLSKILWTLGKAGIIDATRGTGGGYRLRRKAEDIRLIEIVGLFEPGHLKSGCLLGHDRRTLRGAKCGTRTWAS